MKTFVKIVLAVCLLLVVTPFAALAAWSYGSSSVYEVKSPSNLGSAILLFDSGFRGSSMDLYVRDYAASGSKPIAIGLISTVGGWQPDLVVWSSDGTVVAVQREGSWAECYDFRYHKNGTPYNLTPAARVSFVSALMDARGGVGQPILSGKVNWDEVSRHVWPWENFRSA